MRGPSQWPWGRPSGWPLKAQHPVNTGDHFLTSVLVENNPQKPSMCPKLPNLAGPQGCQNIHWLTACCLILGLGRSCTSALGHTKTDRERTSRGGFGAHSEKAGTGRGRLQDRTHRSTLPHQPGWHTGRRQRDKLPNLHLQTTNAKTIWCFVLFWVLVGDAGEGSHYAA